jgi:hypothetical protein
LVSGLHRKAAGKNDNRLFLQVHKCVGRGIFARLRTMPKQYFSIHEHGIAAYYLGHLKPEKNARNQRATANLKIHTGFPAMNATRTLHPDDIGPFQAKFRPQELRGNTAPSASPTGGVENAGRRWQRAFVFPALLLLC